MDKQTAIARLRELLAPGDTVQTILRHRSRSGMSRSISPVVNGEDVSYLVAPAIGESFDRKHGGIRMGGCGMDMGFHLVYSLSHALFPDGFGCIGEGNGYSTRCPSNDHSNGDRDYTTHDAIRHDAQGTYAKRPHWHRDGGYALCHRWL